MNKYDITLYMPALRPHKWTHIYDSFGQACKKYSWEVIFIGPFDPPQELLLKENVQYVKDYGCPSRCFQLGIQYIRSDIFYFAVDDDTFIEDSVDVSLDYYHKNCTDMDLLVMPYIEGGYWQPKEYWSCFFHKGLQLRGIDQNWKICPQGIYNKLTFRRMGGFDCVFEYTDKSQQDYCFRLQKLGGQIHISPVTCANTRWTPDHQEDHGAVHDQMVKYDVPLFEQMYDKPNNRDIIGFDNWLNTDKIWKRRFPTRLYHTYEELWQGENYR